MKKFLENHVRALLSALTVLLAAAAVLAAFLVSSYLAGKRAEESELLLSRSEFGNTVSKLMESLESDDSRPAYHYARLAAEKAAEIGENEASAMFGELAEKIMADEDSLGEVRDAVGKYITGGEILRHESVTAEESGEDEIQPVSVYRIEAADMCVKRLFGEHNPLKRERKGGNGELLYSCSNAYAVIDYRTGLPIEAAISLECAEKRLGEDECAQSALSFIGDFFPEDTAGTAEVVSAIADDNSGTFEFDISCKDRGITVAVRRDNGRISRISTR